MCKETQQISPIERPMGEQVMDTSVATAGTGGLEGENMDVTHKVIAAMKVLMSSDGYEVATGLVDRIPALERDVQERERLLVDAGEALEKEKRGHELELQRNLNMYGVAYDRFKAEKDGLGRDIESLRGEIQEREAQIAKLKEKEGNLVSAGKKMKEEWKASLAMLEEKKKKLGLVENQIKSSERKAGDLTEKLVEANKRVTVLDSSLEKALRERAAMDASSKRDKENLERLEDHFADLKKVPLRTLEAKFEDLWTSATKLVRRYVGEDVPDDLLKRPWRLCDTAMFPQPNTLPQSNSPIAKQLRIIKVLEIMTSVIDEFLLQPSYLLTEETRFRQLLWSLAKVDAEKERLLRGIMLSVFKDRRDDAEIEIVEQAKLELIRNAGVEDMVPVESIAQFEEELGDFMYTVQAVWKKVQHCTESYMPNFDFHHHPDVSWKELDIQMPRGARKDSDTQAVTTKDLDDDAIVLFPRICVMGNTGPRPLTHGTIVRRSQLMAAMKIEKDSMQPQETSFDRYRTRTGRNMSITGRASRGEGRGSAFLDRAAVSS